MRLAIISDIHGNLPALETVLEDAGNNHVDNCIFVGDIVLVIRILTSVFRGYAA